MLKQEFMEHLKEFAAGMEADVDKFVKIYKAEDEAAKGNYEDLRTLRKREWLTREPPARKYIFNYREGLNEESGFLPEGKACMVASPGGCGKTFLLAHCALAAATGTDWLNTRTVRPIKVLFVAAEEDEDELWNRFHRMAKGLGLSKNPELMERAMDNIIALPQRGRNQRLIDDKGQATKAYDDLKKTVEDNPDIKLVILDPAARFMGADTEIDNAAATDWVNLIDSLTMVGGSPTVLVAHHTNKTAMRPVGNDKKPVFDQSMCRGASALVDGFRWVLGLQRSEIEGAQRRIFIKLLKSNYSKMGRTLEFEQDYEAGGILKLIGEVTVESQNIQRVTPAWEAAKKTLPYNAFAEAGESV